MLVFLRKPSEKELTCPLQSPLGMEALFAQLSSSLDAAADALHPLTHCRGWRRACANVGQVGYQSHSLTEVSNRTQDNALDVRQALVQCGTNLSDLQV